jgi:hypothetical protein
VAVYVKKEKKVEGGIKQYIEISLLFQDIFTPFNNGE